MPPDRYPTQTTIEAQADIHHQLLLGMLLMVSTCHGADAVGDWVFRLFRQQHEEKFLSSFDKLGLSGLPHAVACARYHVLSNGIGGVPVEYAEEGPHKAWVRFRFPRWMFDGAVICGVPQQASRGFLKGWYAQNGVSLGNQKLGFVCVSEDIVGYGLCGYFQEFETDLPPDQRLQFAPTERPPPFDPSDQPAPPQYDWPAERLAKAKRNYAVEYLRNGLPALIATLGHDAAITVATEAARLTGLQRWRHLAGRLGAQDAGPAEAAAFLAAMFQGMGDQADVHPDKDGAIIRHTGFHLARGLDGDRRADLLAVWAAMWAGALQAYRMFMTLDLDDRGDHLEWHIRQDG